MNKTKPPFIIFTGGGSAGHVTPNLAIIERCQKEHWRIAYIGAAKSIEQRIIAQTDVPFYSVPSGKLRRYFSLQNFMDPFKVLAGVMKAAYLCWRLKPNLVFSKGGFVAFPVVLGAWINRIPVICHESDLTPGLANRLTFPFARRICVTFDETKKYLKKPWKMLLSGTPIRPQLLRGNAVKGRMFCGFLEDKPIVLVTGGGLGADIINRTLRACLPTLLPHYQIIHLCGKNKTDAAFEHTEGYKQFDYVYAEMADLLACADLIVSRAGANAIYEMIALAKPNLLIPLSKKASRGDQLINADYCQRQGFSAVLLEEDLNEKNLVEKIKALHAVQAKYCAALRAHTLPDSVAIIYRLIEHVGGLTTRTCKNVSELIDFIIYTFTSMYSKFPKEHNMTAEKAFNIIEHGFNTIKVKGPRLTPARMLEIKSFVDQARLAYQQGDTQKGGFLMQDALFALKGWEKREPAAKQDT